MNLSKMTRFQILSAVAILCCSLFISNNMHAMYDPPVLMKVTTKKQPKPDTPITLNIWVMSKITLKNPQVTLKVKKKNGKPVEEFEVWSASQDSGSTHDFEQVVQPLRPGRYTIEAQFVFTAPEEARITMMVGGVKTLSRNLEAKEATYSINDIGVLDVRPHKIYVGGSFENIEQRELSWEIKLKRLSDLPIEKLFYKKIEELEQINGGPWKDKLDYSGESEQ